MIKNKLVINTQKNARKEYWNKNFQEIPEVLTPDEVAKFLRVSEEFVSELISKGSIKTLKGTQNRIFKGFLFAYMTQNAPQEVGLMGGNPSDSEEDLSVGF